MGITCHDVYFIAIVISRKQRGSRAMTERVPQEDTIDSVQGTPFLHDCKSNKPQETLDSGYGYTHVCDVTIYQPYQQRQMTSFLKEGGCSATGTATTTTTAAVATTMTAATAAAATKII